MTLASLPLKPILSPSADRPVRDWTEVEAEEDAEANSGEDEGEDEESENGNSSSSSSDDEHGHTALEFKPFEDQNALIREIRR